MLEPRAATRRRAAPSQGGQAGQGRMNPGGWRRSRARGERRRAQAALPSRCCATNEPATQPIKPPKSAGVSDWKKYTPASHTPDQTPPQSPKNKQTASACLMGHIWGFVAASTAVVAFPCFVAFLPGHDPEAVVLHGEQPAGADRRLCCQHGLSGQDESRWRARTSLSRLESRLMCPECGSRRVSISTRWERDFAPILVAHCGARAQPSGANREKQQGKEDCEA